MRPLPLGLFVLATASPLALIAVASQAGGAWPWLAVLYMAFATVTLDLLVPQVAGATDDGEFPAADLLLAALALLGLALLPLVTWTVAGSGPLTLAQRAALFLAAGLWLGQVGHPAAHELIHRPRPMSWLGTALYSALLFGHHASAHRLVHHRFVATDHDPNSAAEGESLYRFVRRAWPGSFLAGLQAERELRARATRQGAGFNPYLSYVAGAAFGLWLGYMIAGLAGALVWLGLGLHMGFQILLSDYVQHYGLRRQIGADGRAEPVGPLHSWNSPHWFSSALMLNAPRHSDHHGHPTRPYPALRLPQGAPILPWPLPVAATVALFPRLWRQRMHRALAVARHPLTHR